VHYFAARTLYDQLRRGSLMPVVLCVAAVVVVCVAGRLFFGRRGRR
jgi:hypothetical protein